MATTKDRDAFRDTVRRALGHPARADSGAFPEGVDYPSDAASVEERARSAQKDAEAGADSLFAEMEASASEAGWKVARIDSSADAASYIAYLAQDLEAQSALSTAHPALADLKLEEQLAAKGVDLTVMAIDESADPLETQRRRQSLREKAIHADIGITGVDYAIAETGSCVLIAGEGVSRLASLLPPVHVAVVERGQVLPSLDEFFALYGDNLLQSGGGSYMNIISGPSRSADIEQTLVTGVHGPGEVHMLLVG